MQQEQTNDSQFKKAQCPFSRGPRHEAKADEHPFAFPSLGQTFSFLRESFFAPAAVTAREGQRKVPVIPFLDAVEHVFSRAVSSPLLALKWIEDKYGSCATWKHPNGRDFFIVSDSEVIAEVLKKTDRGGSGDSFDKAATLVDGTREMMGDDNVLVTSNEQWRSQHDVIAPFFVRGRYDEPQVIAGIKESVNQSVHQLAATVPGTELGSLVELQSEMSLLALSVALKNVFGVVDMPKERLVRMRDDSRQYHHTLALEAITPFDLPRGLMGTVLKNYRGIHEGQKRLAQFGDWLISREQLTPSNPPTVVTALVEKMKSEPSIYSHDMVRHNLLGLLFASHESSGNILGYTLAVLAERPELATKIRAEAAALRSEMLVTTLSELTEALPFTVQTVQEALRLHPPVYIIPRRATCDVAISTKKGNLQLHTGNELIFDFFHAHREEDRWGTSKTGFPANDFAPERWSEKNRSERNLNKSDMAIYAFGAGSRVCIGSNLFMADALLAITEMLEKFNFTPMFSTADDRMGGDFTLQRDGGYMVRLSHRNGA